MVTLVAISVLFLGVAGAAGKAARRGARWQRSVEAEWRAIAELIGAKLTVSGKGALTPRKLSLAHTAAHVTAKVEATVPVDPSGPSYTRAFAPYALGGGPPFRMIEREYGAAPGIEAQVLGDRGLTSRVRLTTDEPVATAIVWNDTARALAAGFARPIDLRADTHRLELIWEGVEREAEVIREALLLISELAQLGVGALYTLAEIDGAEYFPFDEEERRPAVRVSRGNAEVCLIASPTSRGPLYLARAELGRDVPPFDVRIGARGAIEGAFPAGVLEPDDAALLPDIGVARLSIEGAHVELEWEGTPTVAAADAAVRVLAAIAAGSTRRGAFR
jgi:hypothetical protein